MGEIPFPFWDPVFWDIPGVPVDLRYYGLMYVVGFIAGNFILGRLARNGFLPIPPQKVGDLIFVLILGVILGGRLGYSLFYKPEIFSKPFEVFKVWEGGLSFHGGLIGVVIALALFARKHRFPAWRLGDCMTLAACPGIFFVRLANFVNGELYGRIIPKSEAASVPWAMRFPTDPIAQAGIGITGRMSKREQELATLEAHADGTWTRILNDGVPTASGRLDVPYRHPSQIYEAIAEGLILGLVMWLVYRATRQRPLGMGVYCGIFLIGYGGMRFLIEYFRQPDAIPGLIVLGLTRGQQLCMTMIIVGLIVMIVRWNKRMPALPEEDATASAGASA